jgi:hypothetical protein
MVRKLLLASWSLTANGQPAVQLAVYREEIGLPQ